MTFILDTQAFLWFIAGDRRLRARAREVIADPANDLWLSSGSLWEIAIKISLGKLSLTRPYADLIPSELEAQSIQVLQIEHRHLVRLLELPLRDHRDPFDRLIAAQALAEGVPVVSPDPAFRGYGVELIW